MKKVFLITFYILLKIAIHAQVTDSNAVFSSSLNVGQKIIYAKITTEYVKNASNLTLEYNSDTQFLIFDVIKKDLLNYYVDLKIRKGINVVDSIFNDEVINMNYQLVFYNTGKLKELNNWKEVSYKISSQMKYKLVNNEIDSQTYYSSIMAFNDKNYVETFLFKDLYLMFTPMGDTFKLNTKYLTLKLLDNPVSGSQFLCPGDFICKKIPGFKNSIFLETSTLSDKKAEDQMMNDWVIQQKRNNEFNPTLKIPVFYLAHKANYQYNFTQKRIMGFNVEDKINVDGTSKIIYSDYQLINVKN